MRNIWTSSNYVIRLQHFIRYVDAPFLRAITAEI